MITKFIGAASELNSVTRIALVYTSTLLLESQISELTPDYFGVGLKHIIDILGYTAPEFDIDTTGLGDYSGSQKQGYDTTPDVTPGTVDYDDSAGVVGVDFVDETKSGNKGEVALNLDNLIIPENITQDGDSGIITGDIDTGNDKFVLEEFEHFEFNAIIFYASDMTPIGFTMLDQPVNTQLYGVERLIINPRFIITTPTDNYIEIELEETNYEEHVANTDKMHKRLFKAIDYALHPSEVEEVEAKPTGFTTQLSEAIQSNKSYRYSGNMSVTDKQMTQLSKTLSFEMAEDQYTQLMYPDLEIRNVKSRWSRVMEVNGYIYAIRYDLGSYNGWLRVQGINNSISRSVTGLGNFYFFGSNFFVVMVSGNKYVTYSTPELIVNNKKVILSQLTQPLSADLSFTRNFIDNSLHAYRYAATGVTPLSNGLSDVIDRMKLINRLSMISEIVGYCNGLIVYKIHASNSTFIQTDAPRRSTTSDAGIKTNIPFEYVFNWSALEAVSNKAFLIKKSTDNNWKLFQVLPESGDGTVYTNTIYNLGAENNWRKLDLISMTRVNPMSLNILMTPVNGRVWKLSSDRKTISVL
jgi:hypothetical protein